MSWHLGRLCGFDLETTGVDVETDRIVTACVVQCGGKHPTQSSTWLADPGIEIPEGASKVHGITTEQARTEGQPAGQVVEQVVAALSQAVLAGIPVVAMNAAFDLTMLDREARRHRIHPLADTVGADLRVVDPRVLDKKVDPYRRGGAQARRSLRPLPGAVGRCAHGGRGRDRRVPGRLADCQPGRPDRVSRPQGAARVAGRVGPAAGRVARGLLPAHSRQGVMGGRRAHRVAVAARPAGRGSVMRLPFVSRARHDATVARLIAERNQLAKDLAASEAELAGVSEKWTDTAIVNDCLTEDLVKVRKQLADSQEVEGALAKQIHEMAQPVEPTDAEMDSLNRLIEERDREKRRADHLQRQLDDAVGLPPDRVEDSSRWQPGYEKSGVDAS